MSRAEHWIVAAFTLAAAALVALSGCGGEFNDLLEPDTFDEPVRLVDSDSDGFSDDEEINGVPGTDPFDPTDNPNNPRDTDADGCSDFDEANFGGFCDNDPNTPGSGQRPPQGGAVVRGALRVAATAVVDGDTNDPNAAVIDNDLSDLSRAQDVPNPCTLSGYVGQRGSETDLSDFYRVDMAAGQGVTLLLGDAQTSDFDLYLYDNSGEPVDSSEGTGRAEQVVAQAGGTYLVEVFGYSVAELGDRGGLYTLLVGESPQLSASVMRERLSSLSDFAEDEVLVTYTGGQRSARAASGDDAFELEVLDEAAASGGVERLRVRRVRDSSRAPTGHKAEPAVRRPHSDTIDAVKRLRRQAAMACVQPNYIRQALAVPNDDLYDQQWHYPQIGLPDAWDITTGNAGVIVAVIDTGVVLGHPEFQGQLVDGYDFISDPGNARDGDGIDSNPDDPGDLAVQGSSSFHGTHVSGTIAARSNNGIGVAGVAPAAKVMPLRVLGQQGGTDFDIAQAIRFAAGLANASGTRPADPADIINMSLGGQGYSQIEQDAIDAARNAGVIVIAAAGNESSSADNTTPAGLRGVITVAAVDYDSNVTFYSNFGNSVDVAAPGGDTGRDANFDGVPDGVLSTMGSDSGGFTYDLSAGTSMAAPHVAGVVALMKSVNPDLTPDDIDMLLAGEHPGTHITIVDDLGTPGKDTSYGHGLINALSAVRAASEIAGGSAVDAPLIRVTPRNLDFRSGGDSDTLDVQNVGIDQLEVTAVRSSDDWLSVSGSGGSGTYAVRVNRGGLADGVYTGTLTFESNGGDSTVSVRMSVGLLADTGGDLGSVYVLLVDANFNVVAESVTSASSGYAFEMGGVPTGAYQLYAGTDLDGNAFIDNAGEAFGAYPTLRQPTQVQVDGDVSGIEFSVSALVNMQQAAGWSSARAGTMKRTVSGTN